MTRLLLPTTRTPGFRRTWVSGFSLVEALAVLCVLGIMCSIVIGWYGGSGHEVVERTIQKRNAQEIVSLGVYATVAGADFVVKGDKHATAANLLVGVEGRQGIWKGKIFRLVNLKPTDLPGALNFVKFDAGLLLYEPAGGQE